MKSVPYKRRHQIPSLEDALRYADDKISGVHPACEAVPTIQLRDFDNLVDSIKDSGLLRSIEIDSEKRLIDGRCRLMACYVAGVTLLDDDIVETDVDPYVLARANIDRRHLTRDQRTMYAVEDLEEERKKAKQRQLLGAKKGRANRANPLGSNLVPGETRGRSLRASAKVAKKNGVPRRDVELGAKIKKKSPVMAEQIKQSEITLESAAEQLGLKKPTKKKPKPRKQAKQDDSADSTTNGALFEDDRSSVFDGPDGVRVFIGRNSSIYEHESVTYDVFVFAEGNQWRLSMLGEPDDSVYPTRDQAEVDAMELISFLADSSLRTSTITAPDIGRQ